MKINPHLFVALFGAFVAGAALGDFLHGSGRWGNVNPFHPIAFFMGLVLIFVPPTRRP